jgi:hypothetical protein
VSRPSRYTTQLRSTYDYATQVRHVTGCFNEQRCYSRYMIGMEKRNGEKQEDGLK